MAANILAEQGSGQKNGGGGMIPTRPAIRYHGGTVIERLRGVTIENRPALEMNIDISNLFA